LCCCCHCSPWSCCGFLWFVVGVFLLHFGLCFWCWVLIGFLQLFRRVTFGFQQGSLIGCS
jgi:hypothetical protein